MYLKSLNEILEEKVLESKFKETVAILENDLSDKLLEEKFFEEYKKLKTENESLGNNQAVINANNEKNNIKIENIILKSKIEELEKIIEDKITNFDTNNDEILIFKGIKSEQYGSKIKNLIKDLNEKQKSKILWISENEINFEKFSIKQITHLGFRRVDRKVKKLDGV